MDSPSSSKENRLETEPITTLFFQLAIPAVVAQVVNMLYNMVDRMYIGHIPEIGSLALTGLGIASPIILIVSAFANLIGGGGAPRASIYLGAGKQKQADQVMNTAIAASFLFGLALTVLFSLFLEPLLHLFGASPDSLPYALRYTRIYLMGTIAVMFSLGMNQFIAVQGFAKEAMLTVVVGAVLNIVLDPLFIFVLHLDVAGAALATILSQIISALWVLQVLASKKSFFHLNKKQIRLPWHILSPILALGASPFIMSSTESLLQMAFNRSLLQYGGDLYVATFAINAMVMQIILLPTSGFAQGAVSLLSFNYGAGNASRVKQTLRILFLTNLLYAVCMTGMIELFPSLFVQIFTQEPSLIEATVPMLRIYVAGMFLFGLQIASQQSFLAFGQARISAFMALLRKVIMLIPLIYLLPHFLMPPTLAVYLAEPIADTIAAITTTTTFTLFVRGELRRLPSRA